MITQLISSCHQNPDTRNLNTHAINVTESITKMIEIHTSKIEVSIKRNNKRKTKRTKNLEVEPQTETKSKFVKT